MRGEGGRTGDSPLRSPGMSPGAWCWGKRGLGAQGAGRGWGWGVGLGLWTRGVVTGTRTRTRRPSPLPMPTRGLSAWKLRQDPWAAGAGPLHLPCLPLLLPASSAPPPNLVPPASPHPAPCPILPWPTCALGKPGCLPLHRPTSTLPAAPCPPLPHPPHPDRHPVPSYLCLKLHPASLQRLDASDCCSCGEPLP